MADKRKSILRFILLVLFAALFVSGIFSGEVMVVLKKATNICLECIGIGG